MKLVVGISGATGAHMGLEFIEFLPDDIEFHVIYTSSAMLSAQIEVDINLKNKLAQLQKIKNIIVYDNNDLAASLSSGSYRVDAMCVVPASMNTLSHIALGLCDTLLTRASFVTLKEGRKLMLAPREMPLNPIALNHLLELSKMGVIIAPPMLSFYPHIRTMEELKELLFGRWADFLGIEVQYNRWRSEMPLGKKEKIKSIKEGIKY